MSLIWPSQRIASALADGTVVTNATLATDQLQPASLDLRLGHVAHRLPASFLPDSLNPRSTSTPKPLTKKGDARTCLKWLTNE